MVINVSNIIIRSITPMYQNVKVQFGYCTCMLPTDYTKLHMLFTHRYVHTHTQSHSPCNE